MMWGTGWGSWVVGFLMMAVFWGGLIVLLVLALRAWDRGGAEGRSSARHPDARDLLEQRFVRGEISKDEFEERRDVLEHAAH